jgi:hypothetical protein
LFFIVYLLNGIFIISAREPADPDRLRLWLSGGMVIYALYHCLRCAWSNDTRDLELTDAEGLWLGGAPIQRSSLAIYHVGTLVVPAILKTLLLAVVLSRDVQHVELMLVGVCSSLVLLEITRLTIARWTTAFAETQRRRFRLVITLIAFALGLQLIARIMAETPSGSAFWVYLLHGFGALGQLASTEMIQWMSLPWIPAAHLTVTDHYQGLTLAQLLASIAVLPVAIWALVRVDSRSSRQQHRFEQTRLAAGDFHCATSAPESIVFGSSTRLHRWADRLVPHWLQDAGAVVSRQWVSIKRYRATIAFSFVIPTLLCLSPLVTGQVTEQWFYVVGGIALCTMVLAPPALRIDFRRDLRRMMLLRSLPVKPLSMVIGQVALPIAITWMFQWLTIIVAVMVTRPSWDQVVLWTSLLSALAVFTFAAENALFLAYPHHDRSEGVAMMIRAKLTFLGKGTVIAMALGSLVAWAALCRGILPGGYAEFAFVGGAIIATWCMASIAIAIATTCWRRFDVSADIPPQ